jgi:hypothetical protein
MQCLVAKYFFLMSNMQNSSYSISVSFALMSVACFRQLQATILVTLSQQSQVVSLDRLTDRGKNNPLKKPKVCIPSRCVAPHVTVAWRGAAWRGVASFNMAWRGVTRRVVA